MTPVAWRPACQSISPASAGGGGRTLVELSLHQFTGIVWQKSVLRIEQSNAFVCRLVRIGVTGGSCLASWQDAGGIYRIVGRDSSGYSVTFLSGVREWKVLTTVQVA